MFQVGKLLPRKLIAKQWVKNNDCCVKSKLGKRNEVKLPQTILMIEMTQKLSCYESIGSKITVGKLLQYKQ
jgi:hypothetical protein